MSNPAWKAEDSKYAALILGIVGRYEYYRMSKKLNRILRIGCFSRTHVSVITSNIPYLIDVGLGPRGLEDYHLVQHTLEALMLLCPKPPKNPEEDTDVLPPMRYTAACVHHASTCSLFAYYIRIVLILGSPWIMCFMSN